MLATVPFAGLDDFTDKLEMRRSGHEAPDWAQEVLQNPGRKKNTEMRKNERGEAEGVTEIR
jgi:hypothetical protein